MSTGASGVKDVFGHSVEDGGAFDSQMATMDIGGITGSLIVENLQANYNMQISHIYSITDNQAYYVIGKVEGSGSIGVVFGPGKGEGNPLEGFAAKLCSGDEIVFKSAGVGECGGTKTALQMKGVRLNSVGVQVQAQDMVIHESVGFMFTALNSIAV